MIKLPRRRNAKTEQLKKLAARTRAARRLQTMPGVGPLTALAIEAFAPDMTTFKCGRDFAAWLGLVPRQHSSGGKERLGRVSREGQADIRQLLIVGAMSRANWLGRKSIPKGSWLAQILVRKPRMLVAIALANKSRQFHPRLAPDARPVHLDLDHSTDLGRRRGNLHGLRLYRRNTLGLANPPAIALGANLDRHEILGFAGQRRRYLASPHREQSARNAIAPRHLGDVRPLLKALCRDPGLLLARPSVAAGDPQ
ncbi:hypothetical protein ACVIHI_008175 [Bradyrhizobium sp. USDA 4524]|nr:hypothetical protein [Bradyrhizobium sp. USDA 4538]MCP1899473.1 hypothetical protein [Bradyrhizobium sp. USDA 4537]MCP1986416.1 hypothetical protein [Bradyrhizobium sp. USDA 4539]